MQKTTFVLAAAACAAVGLALTGAACSSSKPAAQLDGGASSGCAIVAGELPLATCDDSNGACDGAGCAIDEARCGSASTCLPMASNKGKEVLDLRMRRLQVVAPSMLAEFFVQNLIVGRNIDLNAPACGDSNGTGSFTWLLRLDRTARKLTTGGAPPSSDPFGVGYCFARSDVGGIAVAPVELDVDIDGDKVSARNGFDTLNVPIYVNGDPNNVVLLPIRRGLVKDITLSADGDCIGRFERGGQAADCTELRGQCSKWKTSGSLGGFITLEDADKVVLKDLNGRTLCGFLTGNTASKSCLRNAAGAIEAKGDFCSTTNAAGGCADAYWLAATFAASAVKIHDGAAVPQCGGTGGVADAGRD